MTPPQVAALMNVGAAIFPLCAMFAIPTIGKNAFLTSATPPLVHAQHRASSCTASASCARIFARPCAVGTWGVS